MAPFVEAMEKRRDLVFGVEPQAFGTVMRMTSEVVSPRASHTREASIIRARPPRPQLGAQISQGLPYSRGIRSQTIKWMQVAESAHERSLAGGRHRGVLR